MSGSVFKTLGPPASAITWRQAWSTSPVTTPGPTAATPACLAFGHHREDPGQLAGRLTPDAERPGHVGAVAVEDGPEVDHHRVPGPMTWLPAGRAASPSSVPRPRWSRTPGPPRRGCAWRGRGPRPRIASVDRLPFSTGEQRRTDAECGVGDGRGPFHAGHLAGVLHHVAVLRPPPWWRPASAPGERPPPRAAPPPTSRRRPPARASAPYPAAATGLALGLARRPITMSTAPAARRGQLLGGLGPVATVGREQGRRRRSPATRRPNR